MSKNNNKDTEQCTLHGVMRCTYCNEEIHENVVYDEDAEPAHQKCLDNFYKHWEDRTEMMDLMGY